MWKINIVIMIVAVFLSCKQSVKDSNCSDFKLGTFYYNSKQSGRSYFITRTASIQTERDSFTGATTKAHINWINDCAYQLDYINETMSNQDTIAEYLKTHSLKTKILKTKKGEIDGTRYNYCVFETSVFGVNQKLMDTLWKHESSD